MSFVSNLLSHPLTKGHDLDDPATTELRKSIINNKPFLKKVYRYWYSEIEKNLPPVDGPVLELGTGAGFLKDVISDLITSDMMAIEGTDLTCSALDIPLAKESLRAIVMINVLHHINDADAFFDEASRCIKPGGTVIMIEPWLTPWSKFVYTNFHHEPFEPEATSWKLPDSGPLSGGNDALPWIIFNRDIKQFGKKHNSWSIKSNSPCMPISYLLSGGVAMRSLAPGWSHAPISYIERHLPDTILKKIAMFSIIVLNKKSF